MPPAGQKYLDREDVRPGMIAEGDVVVRTFVQRGLRVVEASRIVAARLVVVDALHEKVAGFYEALGFRRTPGSLLLVLKISDAEAARELSAGPAPSPDVGVPGP